MNIDVPLADSRRIEVLANGLPLWQGAQAAVDTTFVSPVSLDGCLKLRALALNYQFHSSSQIAKPQKLGISFLLVCLLET